jgi:uncharacterized protein
VAFLGLAVTPLVPSQLAYPVSRFGDPLRMIRSVRSMAEAFARLAAVVVVALGLAFPAGHAAAADDLVKIPALTARVTDVTNTLSTADRQALESKLAAWETQTGNQLVVLMLPSTQPEAIASFGIRVAEAWKIGRKGKDNGAVFIVAKDDHKSRIEVGYGLEGVLTDVTSRRILAETVAPFFRNNQFAQGIDAGVDQIISVVNKGEPMADAPVAQTQSSQRRSGGIPFDLIFILLFVVVPVVGGILRRIFGRAVGSTVGAGIIGAAAWFFASSLIIAIIAAIIAFIVMITFGMGSGLVGRGGGVFIPGGGGGGGGFGGGGGGFSGGGGGFGGGGASGDW